MASSFQVEHEDGENYLSLFNDNSIDLILTDPPYMISRKVDNPMKKYFGRTESFGDWDIDFTIEKLDDMIKLFYQKLKMRATVIIFFDCWRLPELRQILEKHGFKQVRIIHWIKTNPVPVGSKTNYLCNPFEMGLTAVKGMKPTFNSSYDNGFYYYPIQGGKNRFHPTQKNLKMFIEIVKKHSNSGDLVVDPFLGGGTTLFACLETGRRFAGCDTNLEYIDIIKKKILPLSYDLHNKRPMETLTHNPPAVNIPGDVENITESIEQLKVRGKGRTLKDARVTKGNRRTKKEMAAALAALEKKGVEIPEKKVNKEKGPRVPTAYNKFYSKMSKDPSVQVKKMNKAGTNEVIDSAATMKAVAVLWKTSNENPKNKAD